MERDDLSAFRADIVAEARRRMAEILDPEQVNARAHADQARLVENLGGREKLLAVPQWNFTPADSR
jgi:choline-sulfatase